MSANLIVDLGQTAQMGNVLSIGPGQGGMGTLSGQIGVVSGNLMVCSGGVVGQVIDMLHADTFTNVLVQGQSINASGQLRIAVQTSDGVTSGSFTDPTSGLAQFPTPFQSGGILWINSGGLLGGILGGQVSGQSILSGFVIAAGFQRPGEFVRAVALSGDFFVGPVTVSFIGQLRTTGSGGGFSYSPTSGVPSV